MATTLGPAFLPMHLPSMPCAPLGALVDRSRQNGAQRLIAVQFFRSTVLPAAIVLLFGLALFAVSARIWLPGDMAGPAPIS